MAFFDDLGKKISQVGQKTKDMADVSKISALISEEEKTINNNYYQIGKLYASMHSTDYGEEFAGMMQAICASEIKIKELRKQVQTIKGVMRCEKCGADVALDSKFCNSCGAEMPKNENGEELVKCENCSQMVKKGMRFCTNCGKPMQSVVQKGNSESKIEAVVSADKQCPHCGTSVEGNLNFCTSCGKSMQVVVQQENSESDVTEAVSNEKKCQICGADVEDALNFCTSCGAKI